VPAIRLSAAHIRGKLIRAGSTPTVASLAGPEQKMSDEIMRYDLGSPTSSIPPGTILNLLEFRLLISSHAVPRTRSGPLGDHAL
jgi:hypothetical protein